MRRAEITELDYATAEIVSFPAKSPEPGHMDVGTASSSFQNTGIDVISSDHTRVDTDMVTSSFGPGNKSTGFEDLPEIIGTTSSPDNHVIDAIRTLDDEESEDFESFRDQAIVEVPYEPLPLAIVVPLPSKVIYRVSSITSQVSDKPTRDYLISMLKSISDWVLLSTLPESTLHYRSRVSEYLKTIDFLIDMKGISRGGFVWFRDTVNRLLDSEKRLVTFSPFIEEKASMNESLILDLIHREKEHLTAMSVLSSDLPSAQSTVENIEASEAEVKEAEQKAQQLRRAYEDRLKSAKDAVSQLKNSLDEQIKIGDEIKQLPVKAKVARFIEIQEATAEAKSQEQESQKIRDSLAAFFKKD